jgi:hypothetical protein
MEIKAKRASALGNVTAATVFKEADVAANGAVVFIPQGADCFYVRAKGTATGGTTTNFTPKIQYTKQAVSKVTSATAANNLDFFSGGAAAYNSASGPWVLEALCTYDPVNKTAIGRRLGSQWLWRRCGSFGSCNAGHGINGYRH